jgi:hypothetical protein
MLLDSSLCALCPPEVMTSGSLPPMWEGRQEVEKVNLSNCLSFCLFRL